MEDLKDKVVLITGASAGIGEGTAIHFAKLGSKLSLTGRDKTNLQCVAERCKAEGLPEDKILCTDGDLTVQSDRDRILENTYKTYGRLDVLVNNAGMIHYANTSETTPNQYDQMFDVNTRCHFFLSQAAIPYLKESKGNIVNVSSICASKAMPGVTAYCMSKAAMDMFTECLALELAPFGVRVNAVNPGTIVSKIARRPHSKYQDDKDYKKFLEVQAKAHPLGRVGQPEDVAKAIAYFASDQSSFVSGQLMYIDGARHCVAAAVATSVK